ncbi:hypothetical protein FGG08_006664 [Glutinoglossum americanum]|uniref:DUF1774-domain-containing protein n=1 Tax=Glutinoglossum americanum TaxID=1670608 RepID=A0A9P8I6V5_9PEZI|nr:hypothetical protein FGG08_006664 [Glutinoglossum americanum]
MSSISLVNPFSKRESHGRSSLIAYKAWTIITWLLVVVTGLYYCTHKPTEGKFKRRTIFGQSKAHPSPFTLDTVFVSIYWIVLWILQVGYIWQLFSSTTELVTSAANVGSHFILFNLLTFGHIMLWVRSHFWLAELLLVINFFNLTSLYFRNPTCTRHIHIPVTTAPLAWTYMAIFWNGAVMVHAHDLPARILANVVIWGILVFGGFFLVAYKDYMMGFELSYLTAALGVNQFLTKAIALQWIFAFAIMAALFILTLAVAVPGIFGFKFGVERGESRVVEEDRERQPLLDDR